MHRAQIALVLYTTLLNSIAINGEKTRCKRDVCELTPEQGEGPYYIPNQKIRSDIREDKKGLQLNLKIIINDVNTCLPMPNVSVDIWHCDASGHYSGYLADRLNTAALRSNHVDPSDNSTFLRGVQITDSNGSVEFVTIFPGWYRGRAVHIHIESHISGRTVYTGQLFFSEEIAEKVGKMNPYSMNKFRRSKNSEDHRYTTQQGHKTLLNLRATDHLVDSGLSAEIVVAIDPKHDN